MFNFRPRRQTSTGASPVPSTDVRGRAPCVHCGLPLPTPVADWVEIDGVAQPMCCAACAAVAEAVIAAGQVDFYRQRLAAQAPTGEPTHA